jgi:hypothetical protein
VAALGADFVAFTGHKMCGPTGIGVLWGRKNLLAQLPPFFGGGGMIEDVRMQRSTYAAAPQRFEAGTPPIAQAIGLGAAVDYLSWIGMERIAAYEQALTAYALQRLKTVDGLTILGPDTAVDRAGTVSFALGEIPQRKAPSRPTPTSASPRPPEHRFTSIPHPRKSTCSSTAWSAPRRSSVVELIVLLAHHGRNTPVIGRLKRSTSDGWSAAAEGLEQVALGCSEHLLAY